MALVMTSGPALEPVTVSEAKAFMRIDGSAEDVLIASLLLTSRLHIETALGLALITQSWRLTLDEWPRARSLAIPLKPVAAVDAVRVRNAAGVAVTIAALEYIVDGKGMPPRLVRTGPVWPVPGRSVAGIEIDFTAGYGATPTDVPEPIRHAILMLAAHWYEHRDPIEIGRPETRIPAAVSDLLMPFRMKRL